MRIEILSTEGYGLEARVRVEGQVLVVMDDFSAIPTETIDHDSPEIGYLTMEGGTWEERFSGNPSKLKKLVSTGGWSYDGYGQIVSIRPVIADFGLIKLDIGDFTNDERCVGAWIRERIERLELTFRSF